MSAAGVQRVVVRMLFDPVFRDAVYADPAAALAATDLTATERGWVVRPDRRAYATDTTRQARALLALAEELPAATAWARAAGRDPAGFFASPAWHACVEARGVMTLAYAGWLTDGGDPALATLVALEAAVARGRRGLGGAPGAVGTVGLAPGAALVATTEGALAWWDAVRGAAAAGTPLPPPVDGPPCVVLIAVAADGTSTAEVLAEGLAELLAAAQAPQPRAALEAAGRALGLAAADATEIVDELLASDVLIAR